MAMDPATYDEDAYRAQLLGRLKQSELVVYHAVFAPSSVVAEPTLVAATNTGVIHVFELGDVLKPEYWEQVDRQEAPGTPSPTLSFQAHPTQIYTLAFTGEGEDVRLVSGGDQDFRVWKWSDITAALRTPGPLNRLQPVYSAHLPRQSMGYRGALLPYSEINDIASAQASSHVFFAGGDSLAYEWDLSAEQCVRQFKGHSAYLHSLQYVNHSQELVTGSEDGTIGLWDARTAARIDVLTPRAQATTTDSQTKTTASTRWVRSVTTDASETWLACGGGSSMGGYLGMWHLPSRVPVHYTETKTKSDVQDLTFHQTDLLTVGNDATLNKWNRSSGVLLSSARTSVPSSQFCVVDRTTDLIAVGGYAPFIDICMMPGVVSFSLAVNNAVSSE
ncbi:hypothetical protein Poli38472_012509 [Pythium oligandrum]|uniref:THO complex subunit 6 n=1 Tax=Pythium oligandrum TaxID=41045 RepID=A0A8K1FK27_PYTOL|nr:hypothetical protein Poli38472_012509 [Pythium oligandrum]|eukprot:TMW61318.1 hypothetical protein Poli38472_012509 [Pythium oligandrum]